MSNNQSSKSEKTKEQAQTVRRMRQSTMIIIMALALVAGSLFILWQKNSAAAQAGDKTVTVAVVHGDGTKKDFTISTDKEYLGAALQDEKLVSGTKGQNGLYITTVDGETADEARQQWWCITKGGAQVDTGADTTPIANGDTYELTLKTGW